MNTQQHQEDFPEVQTAIYRVALSLDSFLVNGIPYGVIHRDVFNGFLEKTASNLLMELARLEEHAPHVPVAHQLKIKAILAAVQAKCQKIIEIVTELISFRDFPLEHLHSLVSRISILREESVSLIEELECCFQTPKPFYQSRPVHSTATMNDFFTNLEYTLAEEWTASKEKHKDTTLQS
ncbi:MAG TPA: hypothetical protein VN688_19055 [Gemmataceae bacterium]|nr:hypothetical protein [Gemmataceae bacterium]